jgi:alkanesulfonate monooxygenase SsuD/methylene tetrahydromethanopterin reductase-like flavin-dependent oxidoreductase (luciferase family)
VGLFPGVVVVAGRTREEALAKRRDLNDLVGAPDARLAGLAHFIGVDPKTLVLDQPLPAEVRAASSAAQGADGFRQSVLSFFDDENKTVADFLREGSLGHRTLVGDPQSIADSFEEWLDGGAADGFVLMFDALPAGLRDFVDLVVPELQRRGLFRREYDDDHLRDRLGRTPERVQERSA